MKYIARNNAPPELNAWKNAETFAPNRHYDGSLSSETKSLICKNRVQDQGGLCAYTMREVPVLANGDWDAHIEHIIPRSVSIAAGRLHETVDYRNLVACVNRGADLPYGASVRGNKDLPITPFHPNCGLRFRFTLTGKIDAANKADADAIATIQVLKLDHSILDDMRRSAMSAKGLAVHRTDNLGLRKLRPVQGISAQKARQLAAEVLQAKHDGRFTAFCVAIAHAALEHAKRVEKQAERRRLAAANGGH